MLIKKINNLLLDNSVFFSTPSEVMLSKVYKGQLTFSWIPVSHICPSLHYNTISSNCGKCLSSTTADSVNCSNVTLTKKAYICTFAVMPVICDSILGMASKAVGLLIEGII